MRGCIRNPRTIALATLALGWLLPASAASQAQVVPALAGELAIEALTGGSGDGGRVTQMAWGPEGPGGVQRLYAATLDNGIQRFDYDPDTTLSNRTVVSPIPALGIAFHDDPALNGAGGAVMYISQWVGGDTDAVLRRLTDGDGDGAWGFVGDVHQRVVDNVPLGAVPYGHHMNQIQIAGDSLYVGIGVGSDLGDNENAYTGTIAWIEDLCLLSGDTVTSNLAALPLGDVALDSAPYTSSAPDKLRVHSTGARNPFGLALDGDAHLWVTVNQIDRPRPGTQENDVPQDQLFRTFEYADYSYRDGRSLWLRNPVHDWRTDPAVLAAGFFKPEKRAMSLTADLPDSGYRASDPGSSSGLPHGLGPHSSAVGLDFYDGNGLALKWHKDAFVVRQSQGIPAPLGPYEDLVAVDVDSGEVIRIASGFRAPIDVLADARGQMLVAEVGFGSSTKIYRLRPVTPIDAPHSFHWALDNDADWTQPSAWSCDYDGDGSIDASLAEELREFPHAWGTARYAVSIDRTVPISVRLDRHVKIETLSLSEHLLLEPGASLWVSAGAELSAGGRLSGSGELRGDLDSAGTLAPRARQVGTLVVSGTLRQTGRLEIRLGSELLGADRLHVEGRAELSGRLELSALRGFRPRPGAYYDVLTARELDLGALEIRLSRELPLMSASLVDRADGLRALRLRVLPESLQSVLQQTSAALQQRAASVLRFR